MLYDCVRKLERCNKKLKLISGTKGRYVLKPNNFGKKEEKMQGILIMSQQIFAYIFKISIQLQICIISIIHNTKFV